MGKPHLVFLEIFLEAVEIKDVGGETTEVVAVAVCRLGVIGGGRDDRSGDFNNVDGGTRVVVDPDLFVDGNDMLGRLAIDVGVLDEIDRGGIVETAGGVNVLIVQSCLKSVDEF